MAERRMFAKSIIDSDAFLDMPLSTQALYFHLSMRADDDGFVGNPKRIKGMIGASEDDLKLLIAKRFLLGFDSGIVVVKHWWMHNYLYKDRYKETTYINEKEQLYLTQTKAYTEKNIACEQKANRLLTECVQNDNKMLTQVSIGKDSIDKDSIDKVNINNPLTPLKGKTSTKESYTALVEASGLSTKVQEQLLEWLEYKKWKYTEMGIKSLLTTVTNNVDKYGESAVCTVIVESMGNMWQGICWDKLGRKGQIQEQKEEAEYREDGEYLVFKNGNRVLRTNWEAWGRKDN